MAMDTQGLNPVIETSLQTNIQRDKVNDEQKPPASSATETLNHALHTQAAKVASLTEDPGSLTPEAYKRQHLTGTQSPSRLQHGDDNSLPHADASHDGDSTEANEDDEGGPDDGSDEIFGYEDETVAVASPPTQNARRPGTADSFFIDSGDESDDGSELSADGSMDPTTSSNARSPDSPASEATKISGDRRAGARTARGGRGGNPQDNHFTYCEDGTVLIDNVCHGVGTQSSCDNLGVMHRADKTLATLRKGPPAPPGPSADVASAAGGGATGGAGHVPQWLQQKHPQPQTSHLPPPQPPQPPHLPLPQPPQTPHLHLPQPPQTPHLHLPQPPQTPQTPHLPLPQPPHSPHMQQHVVGSPLANRSFRNNNSGPASPNVRRAGGGGGGGSPLPPCHLLQAVAAMSAAQQYLGEQRAATSHSPDRRMQLRRGGTHGASRPAPMGIGSRSMRGVPSTSDSGAAPPTAGGGAAAGGGGGSPLHALALSRGGGHRSFNALRAARDGHAGGYAAASPPALARSPASAGARRPAADAAASMSAAASPVAGELSSTANRSPARAGAAQEWWATPDSPQIKRSAGSLTAASSGVSSHTMRTTTDGFAPADEGPSEAGSGGGLAARRRVPLSPLQVPSGGTATQDASTPRRDAGAAPASPLRPPPSARAAATAAAAGIVGRLPPIRGGGPAAAATPTAPAAVEDSHAAPASRNRLCPSFSWSTNDGGPTPYQLAKLQLAAEAAAPPPPPSSEPPSPAGGGPQPLLRPLPRTEQGPVVEAPPECQPLPGPPHAHAQAQGQTGKTPEQQGSAGHADADAAAKGETARPPGSVPGAATATGAETAAATALVTISGAAADAVTASAADLIEGKSSSSAAGSASTVSGLKRSASEGGAHLRTLLGPRALASPPGDLSW